VRSLHELCLDALRWPRTAALPGTLAPASVETIRARAPKQVTQAGTLDFRTLAPETGGLFDYRVFGPGTVIDAPLPADAEPWKPHNVTFGRLVLSQPIVHPLLRPHEHGDAVLLHELPILPPDLRPLTRLADDRWQVSPINELYRRVIERTKRQQPIEDALLALFDQLRTMCGDAETCAAALAGASTRAHTIASVVFALGFELRA
jgi:DNA-directed RNA polymerase beta' subunit